MRYRATTGVLAVGLWLAPGPAADSRADDPGSNLAEIRATLENAAIPVEERARRALDAASGLDQAAQQAASVADRRARWAEARSLLDDFLARNPAVGPGPMLRFQAGVYAWAEGRSFADQADLAPGDAPARGGAIKALDDAVARLRGVAISPAEAADPFAQNVRFRLAQAIADRARFDPEGDPRRLAAEREALRMLDLATTAPRLRGFARLLRSELESRLGLYGQAQIEIEEAEKSDPPPPAGSILEAKVATLAGRELFEEARKLVAAAKVDDALRGLLEIRIILARRKALAPGRSREDVDADAFRVARGLRGSTRPEARRGLIELARAVDEPGPSAPSEWWDVLAEGHLRLGDPARAGRLAAKGADRAGAAGLADQAATLRYKAGACLFEAEKFAEADRSLTRVVEAAGAPKELRARAGMLRALARGRALATRQAGASKDAYLAALEGQVRDFADDPTSGEARWLLGKVRIAADRRGEAIALWSGIPHGHPRWLEARLAVADLRLEAVEDQRINRDPSATRAKLEEARKSLRAALESAAEGPEAFAVGLRLARLELTPEVGNPREAVELFDRLLKGAARPDQHAQARLGRMVALAESNRFVEAEQVARAEAPGASLAALLPALRLLDRAASEAAAEANRRRFGLVLKVLTARLVGQLDKLSVAARDEARLRHARALLFSGDPVGSRKEIADWGGPTEIGDNAFMRDLADIYLRLDAFPLAIEAEKIRAGRLVPGSLPWFEARYGLALASYRAGRPQDARQVIDATSILHPGLGGGDLRGKFERLRQRAGQE